MSTERGAAPDDATTLLAAMGPSEAIARVVEQVCTVAASDFSVLVLGETGTGKELVARAIHRQSARAFGRFVAVDCGAIPEPLLESELFGYERGAFTGADRRKPGRFHLAERGTLLLDEVGNLPLGLQTKLLRIVESRQLQAVGGHGTTPIDVRFIAATNEDLRAAAAAGRFRADLYFRLAQYTISLPPLRARPSDIAYLAGRFIAEVCLELVRPVHTITGEAIAALEGYDWPGNVRELRNVIRRAVLESTGLALERGAIERCLAGTMPVEVAAGSASAPRLSLRATAERAARAAEERLIRETLRATGGNKTQAARLLETDYKTLHVKMKSLGIRAREFTE